MKVLAELIWLFRWLLKTINDERFRDDVEGINADPSGSWADEFGRVRDDEDGSGCSDIAAGGQIKLSSGDSAPAGRE